MAELMLKDMVKRTGQAEDFFIDSAATSSEELGNPVYPPARKKLAENGIACAGHRARQMTKADYDDYDLIVCMDQRNIRNALRITGGDPEHKIALLLDYADRAGEEVADPWYTGDFNAAWDDIVSGCEGILRELSGD